METHHPHHSTHKKNWTEYLLEFFMLFFAVFLGFVAESWRENITEHHRENQFMVSLSRDLELDTQQLDRIKKFRIERLEKFDSIIIFFINHTSPMVTVRQYFYIQDLFGHVSFFPNSGTLDQLKNSGGLRLIRHRNVVDSIESYDQQMIRMSLRDKYETDFMLENRKLVQKLFEGAKSLRLFADSLFFHKNPGPDITVKINLQYLDEYLNSLITFRNFVQQNMGLQGSIKKKARNLLLLIKKEYQL